MLNKELTSSQSDAIHSLKEGYALEASAGSGKTTVLVGRYCELIQRGHSPNKLLTVSFTNEAADQLRERILQQLDPLVELKEEIQKTPLIGTLHSFCYQVIQRFGSLFPLPLIQHIVTPFDFAFTFQRRFEEWYETLPPDKARFYLSHYTYSDLKDIFKTLWHKQWDWEQSSLNPTEDPTENQLLLELRKESRLFFDPLRKHFLESGGYRFDDLEHYTLELLKHSSTVRRYYLTQLDQVLVDEFQDTSPRQWEILKTILQGQLHKLFIVGDPKQSIYRFRGAEVEIFNQATQAIVETAGRTGKLQLNFRSTPQLVDSINSIAQHLFQNASFSFEPMQSALEKREENPLRILSYPFETSRSQAQNAELFSLVQDLNQRQRTKDLNGSVCLLFRVSDRIPLIAETLKNAGLEVQSTQGGELFKLYSIQDILAYLETCQNPYHDLSLAAFLRSSFVQFTYSEMEELLKLKKPTLLERVLEKNPKSLRWFFSYLEKGQVDLDSALNALFENTSFWPHSSEALLSFLNALSPGASLNESVEKLKAWEKEDPRFESRRIHSKGITLLTVHAAKGLEFDHVYLVDGLRTPPTYSPLFYLKPPETVSLKYRKGREWFFSELYEKRKEEDKKLEEQESKRILYVAMTRAKKTLSLLLPSGPKEPPQGSWAYFLKESL